MMYQTKGHNIIRIGNSAICQINITSFKGMITLVENHLSVKGEKLIINGKEVSERANLQNGDIICFDNAELAGLEMVFNEKFIEITGDNEVTSRLKEYIKEDNRFEGFPVYKRSPRIIKREPHISVEIKAPDEKEKQNKGELVKTILPSVVMIAATVATSMFMGSGAMMLAMVAVTAVTMGISVVSYMDDRKQAKLDEKERMESYDNYLLRMRKNLYALTEDFKESKNYHNLSLADIEKEVRKYSNRIYERSSNDADFLTLSLGLASVEPSFDISCPQEEINISKDPLYLEMQDVYGNFKEVGDIPYVVDLKKAHLGLVGQEKYIRQRLFSIILQLSFFQSYHDIEVITLIDEEERDQFDWIHWLPHCKVKGINVSGLISGENQRDQVLGNINQILKSRGLKKSEDKKDARFLPHYVFIIASPKLIINHSIMEHLKAKDTDLGFSLVYATNLRSNLPENIKTILMIDAEREGTLLLNEGNLVNKKITFEEDENTDFEGTARRLAPLIHNKGVSTQIPEAVSFFELYGVKHPEEFNILDRWSSADSSKSLAVPLGVRGSGKEDIVNLNLHEKDHGPHGLVAGTTGSGKSEILQSYILSLAVNFHPHEVGFLLIDYKGGGMANLFKNLPHLMGTITNLDGSESMRALASIKSELKRRQDVFNRNGVNNINKYTAKFKAGEATEPMPHLFIISDEFAELKKEQPEFMSELVSTARVGRSLGVHLILATQKPSGVVDDQIWSNSRFKLALKVQDETDSKEVLKTPDAANITQPGRSYLQVGNNEIYELFQSAFSGAIYSKEIEESGVDDRIYTVNELGQKHLINGDLIEASEGDSAGISQLEAAVNEIKKVYDEIPCAEVAKPWLPPLEAEIVNPYVSSLIPGGDEDAEGIKGRIVDVAQFKELDLSAGIGLVDMPDSQAQRKFNHDFVEDGNLAVFGTSTTGKSTALMNIVLDLAVKNSPENVNFYVVDFGNSALTAMRDLPHTADYINFDESEKYRKFKDILSAEVARRKKLFAKTGSTSMAMYNRIASDKLAAIMIFIDNYDVVKEMGMEDEDYFATLTRDGLSVGIYTAVSATNSSSMKYAVFNNFGNKISNFTADEGEHLSIVGRSEYKLPDIKGRALVKSGESVYMMQQYLPCTAKDAIEYADKIRALASKVSEQNTAATPKPIPMLPDKVHFEDLMLYREKPQDIVIGLNSETVSAMTIGNSAITLITGISGTGKTNILKLIYEQVKDNGQVFITDSRSQDLFEYGQVLGDNYLAREDRSDTFIEKIEEIIREREMLYESNGTGLKMRDFYTGLEPMYLLIDNGAYLTEMLGFNADKFAATLSKAVDMNLKIFATTLPNQMSTIEELQGLLLNAVTGVVLGNPGDQSEFDAGYGKYETDDDIGYIFDGGHISKIKIPLMEV